MSRDLVKLMGEPVKFHPVDSSARPIFSISNTGEIDYTPEAEEQAPALWALAKRLEALEDRLERVEDLACECYAGWKKSAFWHPTDRDRMKAIRGEEPWIEVPRVRL